MFSIKNLEYMSKAPKLLIQNYVLAYRHLSVCVCVCVCVRVCVFASTSPKKVACCIICFPHLT